MNTVVVPYETWNPRVRIVSDMRHTPVMVEEVVHHLVHGHARVVLDGTVGAGGHAEAILGAKKDLFLIGVDRDPAAVAAAAQRLRPHRDRVELVHGLFSDLGAALGSRRAVDGVLLDLGVSSGQIDDPSRGFSYASTGPLDMRMGSEGETVAERLARTSVEDLADILRRFGEVRQPLRMARAIRGATDRGAMRTTADLRAAVQRAVGGRATAAELSRAFQALRIDLNRELESLRAFLDRVLDVLSPRGRLVVLSYHSLEDRMVKTFLRQQSAACVCPPTVPVCVCGHAPRLRLLTRRVVRPSRHEVAANPRARSARLRAAEKLESEGAR